MLRLSCYNALRSSASKKKFIRSPRGKHCLPLLECLEDRTVLHAVNWINAAGGDWGVAANWVDTFDNSHHVPVAGDDVTINVAGNVTITHTQNVTDTINSLAANDIVQLNSGTLNITAALGSTSSFQMVGGTLGNAIVQAGTTITGTNSGGTLNAVTLDGTLDLTTGGGVNVSVIGGLTLGNSAVLQIGSNTGNLGYLSFNGGNQTLGGTGSVLFGSNTRNTLWTGHSSGTNLTIGPNILIHGQNGVVGANLNGLGGFTDGTFTNQGTISADVSGGAIQLDGTNWTNAGVSPKGIQAAAGATVTLAGSWSNSGAINAAATSILDLNGTFTTANLGTINSAGATVNIVGTLTNTAANLNLNNTTGPWQLLGGTIDGGTVTTTNSNTLIATTSGGTLANGVTLNGTLDLTTAGAVHVSVTGGLTLGNSAVLQIGSNTGNLGYVSFNGGNQTLGGTGSVLFGSSTRNTLWTGQSSGTNLTIGPNILIHGQNGVVGANPNGLGGFTDGTFTNQGTISADVSGGAIQLDGANWTNAGVSPKGIQVAAGATMTLAGSWSNSGAINAAATSILDLNGTFTTANLSTINSAGATVNIVGTLTNTAKNLTLNDTTGSWQLLGGTIDGGTVTTTGSDTLIATNLGGTLANGVTLNGTLDLTNAGGVHVSVTGGLTLSNSAALQIGSSTDNLGYVSFNGGNQTLGGTGSVLFGSSTRNTLWTGQSSGTNLTIGPNILIHGQNGVVGANPNGLGGFADGTFTNQGTISADVSGGAIQLDGANWTNAGVSPKGIQAAAGATVTLAGSWTNSGTISTAASATLNLGSAGANWTNNGSITAANATVNLGGTFSLPVLGTLSTAGATVNIVGTLTNTGSTLTLTDSSGTWRLLGGTIDGGTVATTGANALFATNSGGTLANGVTLNGTVDLTTGNAVHFAVTGGLTLANGTVLPIGSNTGNFGYVSFNGGNQTLGGTGSVLFGSSPANTLWTGQSSGTNLTIGPNILIHGQSGDVGINTSQLGGFTDGAFTNQGTIDADVSGGVIKLEGANWTNAGISPKGIQAVTGATVTLAGSWTNSGTISGAANATLNLGSVGGTWANNGAITAAANATVNLGGTFSISTLGTFGAAGATVNIVGTLTNTGSTLTLTDTSGTWRLMGGTIDGGTVATTGINALFATTSGGTLANGVTLNGTLDLTTGNSPHVAVTGGLTLANGTVLPIGSTTGNFGYVSFNGGNQTLGGTGSVRFGSSPANTLWIGQSSGTNLTIGPNILIHGQSGVVGINLGQLGGSSDGTFTNQGAITADVSGGTIRLDGTNWTNAGVSPQGIQAVTGATVTLAGSWTNSGTIGAAANATLNLGSVGGTWTNNGAITAAANATVNLGGTFSISTLGTFSAAGATVNIVGTLTNTGSTLSLTDTSGTWRLMGGTIDGGTLATTGANALFATNSGGTLANGVTINGTVDLTTGNGVHFAVTGGLTLANGAVLPIGDNLGNFGYVSFNGGSQTLGGTGSVLFGSSPANTLWTGQSSGTNLTIGPNILIHGQNGVVGINTSQLGGFIDGAFTNQGTIDADGAGGVIKLDGANWTNAGAIQARNGATILAAGTNANFAGGTLTGGTWEAFANSTVRLIGNNVTTNAANIVLDGVNSNFFSDLANTDALAGLGTNAAAGNFTVQNGRNFTTAGSFSNAGVVFVSTGSDVRLASGSDYTQTGGDTSINGALDTAGGTTNFSLQGGQLDGVGTIAVTTVTNSGGQVNPGIQVPPSPSTPGALTITGDFTQTAGGALNLRLGGTAAGAFDKLVVSGNVQLGGTLVVTLVNGFAPVDTNSFVVMTFANNTPASDFATKSFPTLSGLFMGEVRNPTNVTLVVVPTPTLDPGSLPGDTIDVAYDQTITGNGGTGNKSLVVSNVQNPVPGLNLPGNGVNTLTITGTPTALGTESFTVTATDFLGATTHTDYSITVNPGLSIAPTSLPQASATVIYNQTITVTGGTTPYTTLAVNNFSGGTTGLTAADITVNSAAGTVTINGTPSAPGSASFTVNVTDAAGATLVQNYTITVLSLIISTPLVSPTSTSEGSSTSFNVSGTFSDPGGATLAPFTAVVDWGDGGSDTATVTGASNPFSYAFSGNHTYAQSGSYNVTVSITDKDGTAGNSAAVAVTVANVAPTVGTPTVSPSSASEGTSTSFTVSGAFTDPAGALDQPFTAVVNWGDGSTDTATVTGAGNPFSYSFSGNHTYAQSGSYNVTVAVTDKDGDIGTSSSVPVTVANVAPTVGTPTVSPTSASEGTSTSFTVSGSFTDPAGALDQPFAAVVDWGDGSTDTATVTGASNPFSYSFSGNHTYAQSGSYNVTVAVTDKDGDTGTSSSVPVTVANVAPTVGTPTVSPTSASEGTGTSFTVSGTFTDPASALDQPFTAVVNWGDGGTDTATVTGASNPFSFAFSGSHTYAQSGSYNVTVAVTDKDGDTGTSTSVPVAVANVAPTVGTPTVSPASASEGTSTSFTVSGSFTDPAGALDQPFAAVIHWGDGITDTATVTGASNPFSFAFSGNHIYVQSGSFNVTVSVADKDGDTGASTVVPVTVANVAPTVGTPTVSPTSASKGTSTSFTVSGSFTDPAGALDQPFAAVIHWGDGSTDTATVTGASNPFSYIFGGSHTYAQSGSFNVTVSVADKDGGTGNSNAVAVNVAGATGNKNTYVQQLYVDLLHRPADPQGQQFFTQLLNSGVANRTQLVLIIEESPEYHKNVIEGFYVRFLGRSAEPNALSFWTAFLGNGGTPLELEAKILGSAEYFNGHGGHTNAGFIDSIYHDVLGRSPDPLGDMFFGQYLAKGGSRIDLAQLVLNSSEDEVVRLKAYYEQFLRRAIEPMGQSYWTHLLAQGVPDELVVARIVGSDEYFARFHLYPG